MALLPTSKHVFWSQSWPPWCRGAFAMSNVSISIALARSSSSPSSSSKLSCNCCSSHHLHTFDIFTKLVHIMQIHKKNITGLEYKHSWEKNVASHMCKMYVRPNVFSWVDKFCHFFQKRNWDFLGDLFVFPIENSTTEFCYFVGRNLQTFDITKL